MKLSYQSAVAVSLMIIAACSITDTIMVSQTMSNMQELTKAIHQKLR